MSKQTSMDKYTEMLKESLIEFDQMVIHKGPAGGVIGYDGNGELNHSNPVNDVVSILEKMYFKEDNDSDLSEIPSGEGPGKDKSLDNSEPDEGDLSDISDTDGEGQSAGNAGLMPNGEQPQQFKDTIMDSTDLSVEEHDIIESLFEDDIVDENLENLEEGEDFTSSGDAEEAVPQGEDARVSPDSVPQLDGDGTSKGKLAKFNDTTSDKTTIDTAGDLNVSTKKNIVGEDSLLESIVNLLDKQIMQEMDGYSDDDMEIDDSSDDVIDDDSEDDDDEISEMLREMDGEEEEDISLNSEPDAGAPAAPVSPEVPGMGTEPAEEAPLEVSPSEDEDLPVEEESLDLPSMESMLEGDEDSEPVGDPSDDVPEPEVGPTPNLDNDDGEVDLEAFFEQELSEFSSLEEGDDIEAELPSNDEESGPADISSLEESKSRVIVARQKLEEGVVDRLIREMESSLASD